MELVYSIKVGDGSDITIIGAVSGPVHPDEDFNKYGLINHEILPTFSNNTVIAGVKSLAQQVNSIQKLMIEAICKEISPISLLPCESPVTKVLFRLSERTELVKKIPLVILVQ